MAFERGDMSSKRVAKSGKYLLGHISTSCGRWSKQITGATRVRDLISKWSSICRDVSSIRLPKYDAHDVLCQQPAQILLIPKRRSGSSNSGKDGESRF